MQNTKNEITEKQKERKLLVIAAIFFFFVLLILFTAGIYFGKGNNSPFLQPFFHLANIIAAVSAGIMTSNLSGFLNIDLESKFGKTGKGIIKAGGGFAVFVLVLTMNPRNIMFDAAENVYAVRHSECIQASTTAPNSRDGLSLCNALVRDFPNRPEAHAALALYHGRKDKTKSGYENALASYNESLRLYGVKDIENKDQFRRAVTCSQVQGSVLEVAMRFLTIKLENALLQRFNAQPKVDIEDALFTSSYKISNSIENALTDETDNQFLAALIDLRAKTMLYEDYSKYEEISGNTIRNVAAIYEGIAGMELPIGFVGSVNWLVAQTCSDHQNEGTWTDKSHASFQDVMSKWSRVELYDVVNVGYFKNHIVKLTRNTRQEPFSVVTMLGSDKICGEGIHKYFTDTRKLTSLKESMSII